MTNYSRTVVLLSILELSQELARRLECWSARLPKFLLNFAMPSVLKGTVSKGKINLHPYINYFFHNSGIGSFRVIHLKFDGGTFGKCRLGRLRRKIKLRLIVRG